LTEVKSSEEIWDVLGTIRWAIEENLPKGMIASVDESEGTVAAELDAITTAIAKLGAMLPHPTLISARTA
jgi:hypothetical protein